MKTPTPEEFLEKLNFTRTVTLPDKTVIEPSYKWDTVVMLLKEYASLVAEENLQRLYDWLMEKKREGANTKFTAGLLRNVAREIEFRAEEEKRKAFEAGRETEKINLDPDPMIVTEVIKFKDFNAYKTNKQ